MKAKEFRRKFEEFADGEIKSFEDKRQFYNADRMAAAVDAMREASDESVERFAAILKEVFAEADKRDNDAALKRLWPLGDCRDGQA